MVKSNWTVAKTDDGTVQITLTIAWGTIKELREETIAELAKDVVIAGYRKGLAPREKALKKIPQNTLVEKTLAKILPKLITQVFEKENLKPIIYPRFELLSANDDQDWQVRATTCEVPEITLGDYKKTIAGEIRAQLVKKEPTKEEKEHLVIKTLLEKVGVKVPNMLIEEEVNARLAALLDRIEKLGLTLEGYLASLGKNAEALRQEYTKQAQDTLALELILGKIAQVEAIKIEDQEVDKFAQASGIPEGQKAGARNVLLKRAVIDSLVALK